MDSTVVQHSHVQFEQEEDKLQYEFPLARSTISISTPENDARRREKALKRITLTSTSKIWEKCCREVECEREEFDKLLAAMGFPPYNYCKDKAYSVRELSEPPHHSTCTARDYLEYFIFPFVLPAIRELLDFALSHRVFQCRFCTFRPIDFICEYLYNHNPFHPERRERHTHILDIPFAKDFIRNNPRPPPPKWLKMSPEEAVMIIQRAYRGYKVRRMDQVQEMRKFWMEYKADLEAERCGPPEDDLESLLAPFKEEDEAVGPVEPEPLPQSPFKTHSRECTICAGFRTYLRRMRSGRRADSSNTARDTETEESRKKPYFCHQPESLEFSKQAKKKTHKSKTHTPPLSCLAKVTCNDKAGRFDVEQKSMSMACEILPQLGNTLSNDGSSDESTESLLDLIARKKSNKSKSGASKSRTKEELEGIVPMVDKTKIAVNATEMKPKVSKSGSRSRGKKKKQDG